MMTNISASFVIHILSLQSVDSGATTGIVGAPIIDRNLLRFLRARKFDLEASLLMLREDDEWRDTFREHGAFDTHDFPNCQLMAEEGLVKVRVQR